MWLERSVATLSDWDVLTDRSVLSQEKENAVAMVVLGIDTHERSHTVVVAHELASAARCGHPGSARAKHSGMASHSVTAD